MDGFVVWWVGVWYVLGVGVIGVVYRCWVGCNT